MFKKKLFKKAKEIAKKGGANPKNKILINMIVNYIIENDMTPEEFKKEVKEGKGGKVAKMIAFGVNIDGFIEELMEEVKKEYKKRKQ